MSTRAREQGRGPAGAPHPASPAPAGQPVRAVGPGYKWIALSNTTLGALMATINSSIILIALPAIFNGIHLNPLAPGEPITE